ncbi:hypothetical protein FJ365_05305 [Candidatus Dependentiae bacterium]|nr:hypothetical protein [Candidatus Dependentiae bacterium]
MKKNMVWLVLGIVMLAGAPLLFAASRKKSRSASSKKFGMPDGVNKQLKRLRALQRERLLDTDEERDDLVFLASQAKAAKTLAKQAARKLKEKEGQLKTALGEKNAAKPSLDKAMQTVEKQGDSVRRDAQAAFHAARKRYDSAALAVEKIEGKIKTLTKITTEAPIEETYWADRITAVKQALKEGPE